MKFKTIAFYDPANQIFYILGQNPDLPFSQRDEWIERVFERYNHNRDLHYKAGVKKKLLDFQFTDLPKEQLDIFKKFENIPFEVIPDVQTDDDFFLVLPLDRASLPANSFEDRDFKSVYINEIANIGSYAFKDCSNLERVYFGSAMHTFESGAFENCILTEIKLPPTTSLINEAVFRGNDIIKITIPDDVTIDSTVPETMGENLGFKTFYDDPVGNNKAGGVFEYDGGWSKTGDYSYTETVYLSNWSDDIKTYMITNDLDFQRLTDCWLSSGHLQLEEV